jgi:hypothetical protein
MVFIKQVWARDCGWRNVETASRAHRAWREELTDFGFQVSGRLGDGEIGWRGQDGKRSLDDQEILTYIILWYILV